MIKRIFVVCMILCSVLTSYASDKTLKEQADIQNRINNIGVNILNSNKINKRIVFVYDKNEYKKTLNDPALVKRQIIVYDNYFKFIENDDELAAFLAHEISRAVKSYSGEWGGFVSATQVKAAPKKYEIYADKRAVSYMVKAGYNPLGLITLINKTAPQNIFDKLLFHNHPSKRMAIIYEYIYYNYPSFLAENTYIENPNFQNFLLNSTYNRALLKEKIISNSKKELKYE